MSGWYTWNLKWIEMSYTSPCFHFIIQTTWLKCLFESFCHNVKMKTITSSYSLFTLTEFLSIWPNYLMLQWYSFIKKKKKKRTYKNDKTIKYGRRVFIITIVIYEHKVLDIIAHKLHWEPKTVWSKQCRSVLWRGDVSNCFFPNYQ